MKIYTDNQGRWVGTQIEAEREFGKHYAMVDVPVSKGGLMRWLNRCRVVSQAHQEVAALIVSTEQTNDT